ncbi:MAG TPA: TIGR03435 family protein [Bryobacteraceae bacterium]|nr:TIGR03435 family protein [Bryobacteraceae bacterium]
MSKIFPLMSGVLLAIAATAFGQTPAAPLSFEVATIKPSPPIDPVAIASGKPLHAGMKIDASRVDIGNFSIAALIAKAYDVKNYQISGPDWLTALSAQRFDVMAKMPEGTNKDQVPEMLRSLLAERFKLTIHRETKEHSVYALVVAKGGPKMKEAEPLPVAPAASSDGGPAPPPSTGSSQVSVTTTGKGAEVTDGQGGKQKMSMGPDGKSMRIENSRISMAMFAEMLTPMVDRPVVDQTDLKGFYQVAIDIPMEELMALARKAGANVPAGAGGAAGSGPADAADPTGGSVFNTVQQLGLKLDARKSPVEHLVIDHVEKMPTEN